MDKQGMQLPANNLVRLILIAVGFFIASAILLVVFRKDLISGIGCEWSVTIADASKHVFGESWFEISCPRKELEFTKKSLVKKGVIDQDKAHKMIADEMVRCWRETTGAGTKDPFSNWNNKGESYCLICSEITYDDPLQSFVKDNSVDLEKDPIEDIHKYRITHPYYYLAQTVIPIGPNKGTSYYEYLYRAPAYSKSAAEERLIKTTEIKPGGVILVYMYKPEDKGFFDSTGGAIIGTVVGAVAGFIAGGPPGMVIGAGIGAGAGTGTQLLATSFEEMNPFSRCEACEGHGGIMLLDSSKSFKTPLKFVAGGEAIETPICTQLVN